MEIELLIESNGKLFIPSVEGDITWQTERQGSAGTLKFNVLKDSIISFNEGAAVRLKVDGTGLFYGFVFKKKRTKEEVIEVTAYDQLRYLKNKDTYVYTNKTADEFIKMVAADFKLQTGTLESTGFKIASRVEENTSLFDMVGNALDLTMTNKKEMFVMFDDFGKIALKNIKNIVVPIIIDEETGENFDYTSSIDENTYNKVKLTYDNEKTGKREVFIAQDGSMINQWGVLQYFDTLQEGENGKAKADALLKLYNQKTRNLSVKNVFGDKRVRAGSLVAVRLNLGDIITNTMMIVEKCKHIFRNGEHFMDLTVRGAGGFVV